MNNNILSTSGKVFQKFIGHLTEDLTKPTTKFITELLCGMLFSYNLVLTNVAARVPQQTTITAIAKRFRRHLADDWSVPELLLSNYLRWLRHRLDTDSLFIVDLTDLAKPYAKKMENIALVRDGDKGTLVTGYWCIEVYAIDKEGILWPVILWPYSLQAEGQLSENDQILKILYMLDEHFGEGFGIWVFDRGFDRINLIEPFLASKRHFIIRQRGDRTVILSNGVHIRLSDLVEHLFSERGDGLVCKKLYLVGRKKPLYVVAYHTACHDEPVILLTDMVAENLELSGRIRRGYLRRWDCEPSIQFLKSKIGLERFAVRRYKSMQRLVFLAGLAMAFLSFLQCSCKGICERVNDRLRYCREPKLLWFYRLVIALQEAFFDRAKASLLAWCRPP